jgi:hypothetical protein
MVGTKTGEVVPEGTQLILPRVFEATYFAQLLEAFEEPALSEPPEYLAGSLLGRPQ